MPENEELRKEALDEGRRRIAKAVEKLKHEDIPPEEMERFIVESVREALEPIKQQVKKEKG